MTVLFICNEYPPGMNGGIGSSTQNLARQMVKEGHTVLVAGLYAYGYQQKDYEEDQGVKVWRKRYRLDSGLIRNNYGFSDRVLLGLLKITGLLRWDVHRSLNRFFNFISSLIHEYNADIIEWPDWNEYFQYIDAPVNYPTWNIPVVVKFHGTSNYFGWQMSEPVNEKIFKYEKQHILRADALVAVSKNLGENMQRLYRLNKKFEVLYNGVDIPPPSQIKMDESTVIFTGALSEKKGLGSLMKAWNLVYPEFSPAKLLVYGKGKPDKYRNKLDPAAKKTVHFKGHVNRGELLQSLGKATAAVFPSHTEGFALGPLEAMSAGCPVIYTKKASGPELIDHGINGLLVDPGNPDEIAENILLLLQDSMLRQRISQQGRNTVIQKFNIEQSAREHIEFFSGIVSEYRKESPVLHKTAANGRPDMQV